MSSGASYDRIGRGYASGRCTDPGWAAAIGAALGDARLVINVGAGTGSYEPADRRVVAVEPSGVMLAQRPTGSAPAIQAVAERLPLPDGVAEAALAVLTVHHWNDWGAGLDELRRVARRRVVVTFDPAVSSDQWIVRDYVPEIADLDSGRVPYAAMVEALGAEVTVLPVSRDFTDGLLGAFWCRPQVYLDPGVRSRMSGFALVDPAAVDRGMGRLADDLRTGAWGRRYPDLAELEEYDAGFRLLVSGP
jgi:SAM-dependent methyltransferase